MIHRGDIAFRQWPSDKPLPTEEEMYAAEARMDKEAKEKYARGYCGDWGFSLGFTMATYNIGLWWHLFFPEDLSKADKFQAGIKAIIDDYEGARK